LTLVRATYFAFCEMNEVVCMQYETNFGLLRIQ